MVSNVEDSAANGRSFQLLSGDRFQIQSWFLPALEEAEYSDWLLIFAHGNAGNISHRQSLYQSWLHLGFNLLAFDYRGYGKSEGRPSESGTYEDLRAAVNWAVSNGYSKDRILLLGKSLGGGVVSEVAKDGQVAGLILHSTFTSVPDLGSELFPILPVRLISTIKHDTHSKLPSLKLPILILHSRADSLIQFHHAERNFKNAKSPKWLFEITGDHNDSEWDRIQSLKPAIETFMNHFNPHQP